VSVVPRNGSEVSESEADSEGCWLCHCSFYIVLVHVGGDWAMYKRGLGRGANTVMDLVGVSLRSGNFTRSYTMQ
jgi:hypothetical protein